MFVVQDVYSQVILTRLTPVIKTQLLKAETDF